MRTIDLAGKNALILGVANQRSLAWAIATALGEAGCRLALTYQGSGAFLLTDLNDQLFSITTAGDVTLIGALDHAAKGITFGR